MQEDAADDINRRQFSDASFLGILRVKMPHPFLTVSHSDYLIQIVDINSHTERQTGQIQISSGGGVGGGGVGERVVYLLSLGRPTDIGFQLGKACYPCSR